MKLQSFFITVFITLSTTHLCNGQSGTIVGSKHDFSMSSNTWNFMSPVETQFQGNMCLPCHDTPSLTGQMPLWDHALSVASYNVYSPGYNFWKEGAETISTPDGSSKLCLSCHDGTVALANFHLYATGTTKMGDINNGVSNLGTDLSTSHPISFIYDATLAFKDRRLSDPTATPSGVRGGTIATDMLENGKLQCTSCHEPHNAMGIAHLLVKSNAGSALCFTCHRM